MVRDVMDGCGATEQYLLLHHETIQAFCYFLGGNGCCSPQMFHSASLSHHT